MALKTLELRARRDALVVFFLGFFLVLTHFLYSQSLLAALAMLVSVWGLLTALVLAHMPVGQPPLRQAGALAARSALLGAPIMVVLFVLFPRIGPLWGMPQDAIGPHRAVGQLRLGGVAELAIDDSDRVARAASTATACRPPRRCTSAGRCCRASTAASGAGAPFACAQLRALAAGAARRRRRCATR